MGLTDKLASFFLGEDYTRARISNAEYRSTLENPNIPIDQNSLIGILSGGPTSSGIAVTETSSLSSTIVYSCVQVICQEIACLPIYIYKHLNPGREKATDHPLYDLLLYSPNPEMTSYQFRSLLQEHLLLWGNAFAEIQRNGRGLPIALWPLMPDRTVAFRSADGSIKIRTRTPTGDRIFDKEEVFHLKNFLSPDGLNGLSTIQKHRQSIGLSLALEEFGAGYFGKGLNPGGFIKIDHNLKDNKERANLKESIEAAMGGLRNAHRLGVLEAGMTFLPSAIKPNDSQFIESRKYQAIDIARIFRVPPHKVGITEASNKATVEQAALEIYSDTLRPHIENWEQEITLSLMPILERSKYSVSFFMDNVLRGDSEARHKNYAAGRQWGYYSINDVREMEGLNPVEGGDGYQLPLNMVDALAKQELGKQEPSKDPISQDDLNARSLIELDTRGKTLNFLPEEVRLAKIRTQKRSVAERNRLTDAYLGMFKRAADNVSRYENKALDKLLQSSGDLDSFINNLSDVYDKLPDVIKREFSPVFHSFAQALQGVLSDEVGNEPGDGTISPELQKFLSEYGDSFVKRWVDSSEGQLNALAAEEEAETQDIEDRIDEWGQTRAEKAARNESVRLNGAISRFLYSFFGVSTIVWVTNAKACPLCVTLEGQEIETTGYFVKEGGEVNPDDGETTPLQTRTKIGHPPLHEACACSIAAG